MRRIERGASRHPVPTGLIRLPDGQGARDPAPPVQRTPEPVVARVAQPGSCQTVLRSLRGDGILVPRRQTGGPEAGELRRTPPSEAVIDGIRPNPASAGASVDGRHGPPPERQPGTERRRTVPPEEGTTIHQGVYPADIGRETFLANRARLRDTASADTLRMRGAVREGTARSVGPGVWGRCGRRMHGEDEREHRHVCSALQEEDAAPGCLHRDGPRIEAVVVAASSQAPGPAELAPPDEALAALHAEHARLAHHDAARVTRAEDDARLAPRQDDGVDPDTRGVAGEPERRWEVARRALREAREARERSPAAPPTPRRDPALCAQLNDRGRQLPARRTGGRLSPAPQKELLRGRIRRVVLTRPQPERVEATVAWISGAMTPLVLHPPVWRLADLADPERLAARVQELSAAGHHDREVARRLTVAGLRSPGARRSCPPSSPGPGRPTASARSPPSSVGRRGSRARGRPTAWPGRCGSIAPGSLCASRTGGSPPPGIPSSATISSRTIRTSWTSSKRNGHRAVRCRRAWS